MPALVTLRQTGRPSIKLFMDAVMPLGSLSTLASFFGGQRIRDPGTPHFRTGGPRS